MNCKHDAIFNQLKYSLFIFFKIWITGVWYILKCTNLTQSQVYSPLFWCIFLVLIFFLKPKLCCKLCIFGLCFAANWFLVIIVNLYVSDFCGCLLQIILMIFLNFLGLHSHCNIEAEWYCIAFINGFFKKRLKKDEFESAGCVPVLAKLN